MEKQWFVLHTLTGQEQKAQKSIEARVRLERMEDFIGRCVIPTERVTEKKDGKKRTITRKFFPGYVLCELALYDEAKGIDDNGKKAIFDRTWQFLRETPGVIGFVTGERAGQIPQPIPLRQSEIDAIFSDNATKNRAAERPRISFAINDEVKIVDGAFMGLTGAVTMVDPDKGKLKVEVEIFGRKVLADAECWQVEKVDPAQESAKAAKSAELFSDEPKAARASDDLLA